MRKRNLLLNILLYSVFAFYIIILLYLLLFKSVSIRQVFSENRRILRAINIVPFDYLTNNDIIARSFAFSNVFGNIVLFIPMGIYMPLLRQDEKIPKNILLLFFMSLSVEVIQYIFAIGITDIDDIILNCLGGFIGIITYKGFLMMLVFTETGSGSGQGNIVSPLLRKETRRSSIETVSKAGRNLQKGRTTNAPYVK